MRKRTKPENLKSRRVTLAFRMLPEMHALLRQAAHAADTSMGRYLEKALRAQIKRDGINENEISDTMKAESSPRARGLIDAATDCVEVCAGVPRARGG
jgi:hypothetical protein